jgi:hypothetical protein
LVADGQSPVSAGNIGELEVSISVALGEHEVLAIGVSEADPALGPGEGIAGAAGIESLVRSPAQALDIHLPIDCVGARTDRTGAAGASTNVLSPGVDDRGIGKSDGHVISGRPVLLEVARLADADEGLVGMLAIQRVGLDPLFTACDTVRARVGLDAEFIGHQVGNDRLASQGR